MKRILTTLLMLVGLMGLVTATSFAQTVPQNGLVTTTLSAAVTTTRATTLTVSSATGWTASTFPGNLFYAYVDHEAMVVRAISGTTITVDRGVAGTSATTHASGAAIFTGAAGQGSYSNNGNSFVTGGPFVQSNGMGAGFFYGSCTRTAQSTLPLINLNTGQFIDCNGGVWIQGTNPADSGKDGLIGPCNIPIGSVAYASVGTNTSDVNNKRMVSSVYVPRTGLYSGIQFLQGGTATTDNITAGLYDASGVMIANTGATGVLVATANTFKNLPFVNLGTKVVVVGPAMYFVGLTGNGATAGAYQTVPTLTFKNILSQGTTSITFGTFPNFVVPTTFTADLAPIFCFSN